jgi:gamma-glutamyltranspeptidase
MAAWRTIDPPVTREIEYQKDDGTVEKGKLARAGRYGAAVPGAIPGMRQLFRREGDASIFEIKRWRGL